MKKFTALLAFCLWAMTTEFAWGQVASRDFEHGDSTDAVTFGDVLDSVFSGADATFSLVIWVKYESFDGAGYLLLKLADGGACDADQRVFAMSSVDDTGTRRSNFITYWDLAGTDSTSEVYQNTITTGTWYHIVALYDGTTDVDGYSRLSLYMDGTEQTKHASLGTDSWNAGDDMNDSTSQLSVGNGADSDTVCGYGSRLDGLLAYPAIYDRVLTAAEINQLMHCPGSVTDGLVGYWPLTDSSTQYDQSPNSNNGTNSGTTASTNGPPISANCALQGGN
ncbi:MAG: LamG-like jellyroll fold domain-containing protein [Planctomycetota bacterium]|jgi:hypothetical protein